MTVIPPPYAVVPRIPADQPFVVQPSATKRALLLGGLTLGTFLVVGSLLAVFLTVLFDPGFAGVMGIVGCLLLSGLFFTGLQFAVQHRAGPALAVGPDGLWIRTRPFRSGGIWLPWAAVAEVYRRTWLPERYLCVRPHDPRAGQHLGGFGGLDAAMSKGVFGTGLLVSLRTADRSEDEIMRAVAWFAAGRVPVR
ncbi:hypothetical protein [Spirilliplanes yamanashiensis]|uniref:Uncharacterized protein n=1 Tax=Spirilliplanes yamanashiensis TaxID=42233 RepID=A0A8J4DJI6_9ACTN|nr:hypothetical protein [Spirilliplanes yamanashiensis]MDP9815985.1 hypothetical protein [Spirilliplanes yamanashiensis]GIJ04242.1 hypothetical protein Sya03_35940 [Spirilliplanes yamanashiensis]